MLALELESKMEIELVLPLVTESELELEWALELESVLPLVTE